MSVYGESFPHQHKGEEAVRADFAPAPPSPERGTDKDAEQLTGWRRLFGRKGMITAGVGGTVAAIATAGALYFTHDGETGAIAVETTTTSSSNLETTTTRPPYETMVKSPEGSSITVEEAILRGRILAAENPTIQAAAESFGKVVKYSMSVGTNDPNWEESVVYSREVSSQILENLFAENPAYNLQMNNTNFIARILAARDEDRDIQSHGVKVSGDGTYKNTEARWEYSFEIPGSTTKRDHRVAVMVFGEPTPDYKGDPRLQLVGFNDLDLSDK